MRREFRSVAAQRMRVIVVAETGAKSFISILWKCGLKMFRPRSVFQLATSHIRCYSPSFVKPFWVSTIWCEPLVSFQFSRRNLVQEHLIELCVGETLQVGRYRVTLLQVDGDELSIEVDGDGEYDLNELAEALALC